MVRTIRTGRLAALGAAAIVALGPPARAEGETSTAAISAAGRVPTYVAFGAGAVGVGVDSASRFGAPSRKSDLDAVCKDEVCPRGGQDSLGSAKTALVSSVGLAVGVIGLGAGLYSLLLGGSAAPPPTSVQVQTWIGPTGGGITGTF
jgi:hypothetical protein